MTNNLTMKKSVFSLLAMLILCFFGCDDTTGNLGNSIIPGADSIEINTREYQVTTRSVAVDSVLGKTGKVYLGRFSDPQTQSIFEADFIAQFNCAEGGMVFPDSIVGDSATYTELRMFFTSFFGDSTNTMSAEVYELEQTLREGEKYYTNLDVTQFYDPAKQPLAQKVYTAIDYSIDEDEREDPSYYTNVTIPLPNEIGTEMIRLYRTNPEFFANATSFIENICPGYYVKSAGGDGTVLYIDQVVLNVHFKRENDSTYVTQFAGSEEVLQTNRFSTQKVQQLVDDNSCTYLKTPAGIFTEATLPIDSMMMLNDSINSAQIVFTRYNNDEISRYAFGTPKTLLMVRKGEMNSFFEKNKLADNLTSYYTTYNESSNRYEYFNIARLVIHCNNERQAWLDANPGKSKEDYFKEYPDWNKVLLVPVTTVKDTHNNIVNFRHDLSLNSARLVGGKDKIVIKVIASKF